MEIFGLNDTIHLFQRVKSRDGSPYRFRAISYSPGGEFLYLSRSRRAAQSGLKVMLLTLGDGDFAPVTISKL